MQVEATRETDDSGWRYATRWSSTWQDHSAKKSFVRRRKWFRVRKSSPANEAAAVEEGVPPDEGPTS